MCQIDNCNNPLKPISVSREERRLFLKGMIALPLAAIFTNMDLLHAQAGKVKLLEVMSMAAPFRLISRKQKIRMRPSSF